MERRTSLLIAAGLLSLTLPTAASARPRHDHHTGVSVGYGYSPYGYGSSAYGYSSYGYGPGYGYSPYGYGSSAYGYAPNGYGHSPYSYGSPAYGYSSYGYGVSRHQQHHNRDQIHDQQDHMYGLHNDH